MKGNIASLFGPCRTVTAENIKETFKLAHSDLARLLEQGRLFVRQCVCERSMASIIHLAPLQT